MAEVEKKPSQPAKGKKKGAKPTGDEEGEDATKVRQLGPPVQAITGT